MVGLRHGGAVVDGDCVVRHGCDSGGRCGDDGVVWREGGMGCQMAFYTRDFIVSWPQRRTCVTAPSTAKMVSSHSKINHPYHHTHYGVNQLHVRKTPKRNFVRPS